MTSNDWFKKRLPQILSIEMSTRFSSQSPNNRLALRQRLYELTAEPTHLDLSMPPRAEGLSLSVSHCPTLGGYVVVNAPAFVGIDIEQVERVTPALVERVSKIHVEVKTAPSPAHLWTAKESSWKCFQSVTSHLNIQSPETLSEIAILNWQCLDPDCNGFKSTAIYSEIMVDCFLRFDESNKHVISVCLGMGTLA